jgi:hypothetical protein
MSAPIRTSIASNTPRVPEPVKGSPAPSGNTRTATPVVRTLKPPPEIWELVHPVPTRQFKPGRTFVNRLSSGWTNLILLAVAVGVISGVCTTIWRLRSNQNTSSVAPAQQMPAKQTVSTNVGSAGIGETTNATHDSATPAGDTSVIQPTDISVNDLNRTTSVPRKRTGKKSVTVAPEQQQSNSPANAETGISQQSAGISQSDNKGSADSASTKPKNSTLSPQLIAPLKASPERKPKVIQWP